MKDSVVINLLIEFGIGFIYFEIYMAIHQAIYKRKNKRD